ncbi:MAG: SRPBCC family protein [Pseudomonadales bacterium]|nr:SRPBCC family protein [Pseudomonadales bacterium]
MTQISEAKYQVIIDIPVTEAWNKLQDLTLAHHYVPGIVRTELVTENKTGVGASRKVFRANDNSLQETVTEWHEGSGFKIRLHKGEKDAPFKNAYFQYQIEPSGSNKTRFVATMGYTPPLGRLGKTLDSLLLNKVISGVIRDVAVSMKHFYETGIPTKKSDMKRLRIETVPSK